MWTLSDPPNSAQRLDEECRALQQEALLTFRMYRRACGVGVEDLQWGALTVEEKVRVLKEFQVAVIGNTTTSWSELFGRDDIRGTSNYREADDILRSARERFQNLDSWSQQPLPHQAHQRDTSSSDDDSSYALSPMHSHSLYSSISDREYNDSEDVTVLSYGDQVSKRRLDELVEVGARAYHTYVYMRRLGAKENHWCQLWSTLSPDEKVTVSNTFQNNLSNMCKDDLNNLKRNGCLDLSLRQKVVTHLQDAITYIQNEIDKLCNIDTYSSDDSDVCEYRPYHQTIPGGGHGIS